mgnify:CR=1 FL=1
MNSITTCYLDKKTVDTIDRISNERKWSRSKVIREAICFFNQFGMDEETIDKIENLSKITRLSPKKVVAYAIGILEDIMKRGE